MTNNVSVTTPLPFSATRRTFESSSIRFCLLCRRPAVSASTRSMRLALARSTASNTTLDGSAPSAPRTISAPERSAQVWSWSAAAARNVSPADNKIVEPDAIWRDASFPIVVVLPTPLTPTNNQIDVPSSGRIASSRFAPASCVIIDSRSAAINASGLSISPLSTRSRNGSSNDVATLIPTSAISSASSSSSHTESSMAERPSTEPIASENAPRARAKRSRIDFGASGSTGSASALSSPISSAATSAASSTSADGSTAAAGAASCC